MKRDFNKILCTLGIAVIIAMSPMYAEAATTKGVRIVKVALPAEKKTETKKAVKPASPGTATVSKYTTTGIDSTAQEQAAKTWVLGILGGDREYSVNAPALFKTEGLNVKESDVIRFMVLREALYSASSWAIGQAKVESIQKGDMGVNVALYLVDTESLVSMHAEKIAEIMKVEPSTARIIAEWKVAYELKDPEKLRDMRYITTVKKAPINAFGKLSIGPNNIHELLSTPEKEAVKAIETAKKYKLTYAKPYIDDIAFIVEYSSSLEFSHELKEVLLKK